MRRLRAAALALMVAGLLPASLAARAADAVAPNDPVLIESMTQLCLRAALSSGGIDKTTKGYCDCVAPIFARHMTPDFALPARGPESPGRRAPLMTTTRPPSTMS